MLSLFKFGIENFLQEFHTWVFAKRTKILIAYYQPLLLCTLPQCLRAIAEIVSPTLTTKSVRASESSQPTYGVIDGLPCEFYIS